MNNQLTLAVSPHIHSGRSTRRIMLDVIIALLPTTIAGAIIFGWTSLLVVAVTVASSVIFEVLFNLVAKKKQTVGDFSAVVTGLLLALNLPATIPLWQCVVGALFAIVVVKGLFGGLGSNPVNPAITARVFMLIAFGSLGKSPLPLSQQTVDAVTGATPLATEEAESLADLFLGNHGGAIGEVCALALLLGLGYLLIRRVITWHIPVAFVGTVFIGAIFMATDYVTSPATPWGKIIFGVGAGVLTFLIRYFGNYPEGVSFAILFMNIITPFISSWTRRRVFGKVGKKA